jgi:hypothetical protein
MLVMIISASSAGDSIGDWRDDGGADNGAAWRIW